ncbi:MAG: alpha/beta fold hydrolase [Marmoricola sp.]
MSNAPQTRRHTYAGVSTRRLSSDGDGPTVVFLHGFMDSADTWGAVMKHLRHGPLNAVAVDLPGFGEADDVNPGPLLPQLDRFVQSVLDTEAPSGPVVLVGNSLGAALSLRAAKGSSRITGVVAIAEPTHGTSWFERQLRAPRPPLWFRLATVRIPIPTRLSAAFHRVTLRYVVGGGDSPEAALAVERLLRAIQRRGGNVWVLRTLRAIAREAPMGIGLEDITCRVLVIHGRRDRLVPPNAARAVHRGLPTSELIIDPTWGHCPQLNDPERVAGLITAFTERITLAPPSAAVRTDESEAPVEV